VVLPALQQMRRLTHLELDGIDGVLHLPVDLTRLIALKSFYWSPQVEEPESPLLALPPGAWLAGLQRLGAPTEVHFHSLPALEAATSLEVLCVTLSLQAGADSQAAEERLGALLRWAGRHPRLEMLQVRAAASYLL